MKHTAETAKALTPEKLLSELIEAHKNSIAKSDPNFPVLQTEILERLNKVPITQ